MKVTSETVTLLQKCSWYMIEVLSDIKLPKPLREWYEMSQKACEGGFLSCDVWPPPLYVWKSRYFVWSLQSNVVLSITNCYSLMWFNPRLSVTVKCGPSNNQLIHSNVGTLIEKLVQLCSIQVLRFKISNKSNSSFCQSFELDLQSIWNNKSYVRSNKVCYRQSTTFFYS